MTVRFEMAFDFSGEIQLMANDPEESERNLSLLRSALDAQGKLGLDIGIKTPGNYWTAVFFRGENLEGDYSVKVQKNSISLKGEVRIVFDGLPSKIAKSIQSGSYQVGIAGLYVDGRGLVASKDIQVAKPVVRVL